MGGMKFRITKLNKDWWKIFLCFAMIIEPKIFTQYKITVLIYAIGNMLIFFSYVYKYRNMRIRIPKILFFWGILRIYLLFLMLINKSFIDLDQWGYMSLQVANMIFIIHHSLQSEKKQVLLSAIAWLSILYLGLNAVSLVYVKGGIIPSSNLYENGDNDYYFLGIKVTYTTYIIPAIAVAGLYKIMYKKRLVFIITVALSLFNIFYANISTAKVCLIIFVILFILKSTRFFRKMDMSWIILVTLAINILIVGFDAHMIFADFIQNVLHKNLTLTGRTDIWKNAKTLLMNSGILHLLFGNGIRNGGSFVPFGGTYWPAHNQWLQYVYEYGLLGIVMFLNFLIKLDRFKNKYSIERYFILCICATTLFGTITMQYLDNAHIYIPFIFLYYIQDYI